MPQSQQLSPIATAMDVLLREKHNTSLVFLLRDRRRAQRPGGPASYEAISEELHDLTGLQVSYQTVKRWCDDLQAPGANAV